MKRALVTLAVGDVYLTAFHKYCLDSWYSYGQRHGYDIIVITELPDNSERALNRSPAWQKCLVGESQLVQQYEQVVWLDADIVINSFKSPCVCQGIATDKVAAVDDNSVPSYALHSLVKRRMEQVYGITDSGMPYRTRGISTEHNRVVQTGVLVFSPRHHQWLFRKVYDQYEDLGDPSKNYEMFFLSHELLQNNMVQWLDYRFNFTVWYDILLYYPFLFDKVAETIALNNLDKLKEICMSNCVAMNYFAHFAGIQPYMAFVDQGMVTEFSGANEFDLKYEPKVIIQ